MHEGLGLPTKNIMPFTERRYHQKGTQDHGGWKMYWLWNIESHPYF